ncbi:cathelicidin-1-like [Ambystoma mexicanum]|uniref:cathelicidin-1-like n=1 Tax=Ambystoma mexicanum TaxID=8296 RepID=UPI0037E8C60D
MQSWLRLLPVLAVATAAAGPPIPKVSWTVEDAVDFYNEASSTDYIFKLVDTDPGYGLNESARLHQLQFTMKETECLKSENKSLDDCDFQVGGRIQSCSAVFLVDPERNAIVISCDDTSPESARVRRSSWRSRHGRRPAVRPRPANRFRPSVYTNIVHPRRPSSRGTGLVNV